LVENAAVYEVLLDRRDHIPIMLQRERKPSGGKQAHAHGEERATSK
jgi:hypothetical protein